MLDKVFVKDKFIIVKLETNLPVAVVDFIISTEQFKSLKLQNHPNSFNLFILSYASCYSICENLTTDNLNLYFDKWDEKFTAKFTNWIYFIIY